MVKRLINILIILFSFMQIAFAAKSNSLSLKKEITTTDFVAGQFVVKFKPTDGSINNKAYSSVLSRYSIQKSQNIFADAKNKAITNKLNLNNVFIMKTDVGADILQIVKELSDDPTVEYAEPVYLNKLDETTPDDALYSQLFHLPQISAPQAWDLQFGPSNVVIGIIDTGVDWDHEDLIDIIWTNTAEIDSNGIDDDGNGYIDDVRGWDFVTGITNAANGEDGDEEDNNPMDFNGHGTHVSGIAGGHTNNTKGIASAAAGAIIMPLRCGYSATDGNGYVPSAFAANAYIYAADNGANITNQSSGNSGQLILDAAYYAFLNGVLIVISAGNGNDVTPSALGSQSWVISVASVRSDDVKSWYSSFGEYVNVSAPGGDSQEGKQILSTYVSDSNTDYVSIQGTSMAAPLVASAAGLIKGYEPDISVIDLFERVVKTADNIDALNPGFVGKLGSGRINVYRALTEQPVAEPKFVVLSTTVEDLTPAPKDGNGDGRLDPGEVANIQIDIRNIWQNAENVLVELTSDQSWPITILNGTSALGNVGGILDTNTWNATSSFSVSCADDAYPTSVKLTLTITATNFSQSIDYYLSITPRVLFVADFASTNNELFDFSSFYLDALGNNGVSFDQVHHSETTVDADLLNRYNTVIWACEWAFPTLEKSDQDALSNFMDNGGSLFISGQDIGWQLNEDADFTGTGIPFFNNYLKSTYLADNVGFNYIEGVVDDPITNKTSFDFYQERRSLTQQFPDGISPLDGAKSILNYENSQSGGISYDGDYRLVYFSFGGFEAITDNETRIKLMGKITDFLDGVDINHQRIRDREETAGNYDVNLGITLDTGVVDSVLLYWDTDGEFPFNINSMASTGDGNYTASIPAQETGTTIEYFIYITTSAGKSTVSQKYTFKIGADNTKPVIDLKNDPYWDTVNAFGPAPYNFTVSMDDNLGIDSATTRINYWADGGNVQSTTLSFWKEDLFTGSFNFEEAVPLGNAVNYYFSVSDASTAKNEAVSDTFSFKVDSMQTLDGFEKDLSKWDTGLGWNVTDVKPKNGIFSITDSPDGEYENNQSNPLSFKIPFNLSNYKYAEFSYWIRSTLETNKDSLLVEASNNDGADWKMISNFARTGFSWRNLSADMTDFTGPGNENVWIRFRLQSDSAVVKDGVYLDDPVIKVSTSPVTAIIDGELQIPKKFSLKQNYPNPFNPETTLEFSLPQQAKVTLTVYNLLGQKVAQLLSNADHQPGKYKVIWLAKNDYGTDLATGVYVYRLKAISKDGKAKTFTKKMLFLK